MAREMKTVNKVHMTDRKHSKHNSKPSYCLKD